MEVLEEIAEKPRYVCGCGCGQLFSSQGDAQPHSATVATNTSTNVFSTGNLNIDALLGGTKWGGAVGTGSSVSFSFAFYNGMSASYAPNTSELAFGRFYGFNAVQAQATRTALQAWSEVSGLTFGEVGETTSGSIVGDIRFAFASATFSGNTWGYASFPFNTPRGGDVWLNANSPGATKTGAADWKASSYNYMAILHEIGHALGLKHPGNYDSVGQGDPPFISSFYDITRYSVMSYNDTPNQLFRRVTFSGNQPQFDVFNVEPETPMVLDIAAIQYMYGANMAYRTGSDTYTFDTRTPFYKTIWDAGGNDTISVSNFSTNCVIDLTPGSYSSISISSDPLPPNFSGGTTPTYTGFANLGIAFNVIIENAVGGSGADTLIGNAANNTFTGNGGFDSITGGAGVDTAIYSGARANYTIRVTASGTTVTDSNASRDGSDTLSSVERLKFADGFLAVDISGNAGQAYRLYKAAFNRTPDVPGLGFQIKELDNGLALNQVSQNFINSPEFARTYGSLNTSQFVTQLYQNVLNRVPAASELGFYTTNLTNGTSTRSSVLIGFSESPENQAAVIGSIQNGIAYAG